MRWRGEGGYGNLREGWVEDKRYVFERWVRDKITIWKNVYLCVVSLCMCD